MMKCTKNISATLLIVCIIGLTGCFKTRGQIKNDRSAEENEDAGQPSTPSSKYEIEELKNEMTRLTGKVEELEHQQRNGQQATESSAAVSKLESRVAELEKNQLLIMTELKALKDKPEASHASNDQDLFAEANRLYKERKYEDAAEKFRQVLNRGVKGNDAAEANYGLGECEFALKNFKKAIVAYSKVQEVSSKSARIPASLYKIALSFQSLNMAKEARGFFHELIERYPRSPEAKKAKARLKG